MTERLSEVGRPVHPSPSLDFVGRLAPRWRAALPLGFFGVVYGIQWFAGYPHVSGDTQTLLTGAQAIMDCVEAGEWTACEATPAPIYSTVGPFAVLQYVPTVAVLALGGTATTALTTLWVLSGLAFAGVVGLGWLVATRIGEGSWAPGLTVVAITGPLLFYANSTFGEMLAAFLALQLVAVLALRLDWWAHAGAAFLAGVAKETAAPFLAALALIVVFGGRHAARTSRRSQLVGVGAGLSVALVAHALFNVFRYGTPLNQMYLEVQGVVQGLDTMPLERRPEFLAALFVSPNGGLLFFWPAAALLFVGTAVLAFGGLARRPMLKDRWPALALVATLTTLLVSLASYPYPFGWHTWGPRYTISWVPALALAAVIVHPAELARLARVLVGTTRRLVVTATVLTLLALPHAGAFVQPGIFARFFLPNDECPSVETLRGDQYVDCLSKLAWVRKPMLLDGISALRNGQPAGTWVAGGLAVAVFGLLAAIWARVPNPHESAEDAVMIARR